MSLESLMSTRAYSAPDELPLPLFRRSLSTSRLINLERFSNPLVKKEKKNENNVSLPIAPWKAQSTKLDNGTIFGTYHEPDDIIKNVVGRYGILTKEFIKIN